MKIIKVNNYDEMSREAADIVEKVVKSNPKSVLGLATGSTPIGMYKEIIKKHNEDNLSFEYITSFNLDEYYGLDRENNQSYYYYMNENLFKYINIDKKNTNIPNGMAEDIEIECKEYEKRIENEGGVDIQILGIGRNGHIGFNEPNDEFEPLTHMVELDEQTIQDNSRFFESLEQVPTKAISMGIKTIMKAKKIILLASGKEKADAVKEALYGKITPQLPASILQLHPDVTIIVDKEAAKII